MRSPAWITASLCGAAFATVLILACGDDDSSADARADAGACDCPAAEPPLAGRIVRVVGTQNVAGGGVGGTGVLCPTGSTLLGGGCKLADNATDPLFHLINAGTNGDGSGYRCTWQNSNSSGRDVIAEAFCLVPPQ
ncbi:MAG: hypothetical protein HS111_08585 [Kofleriaceae bacterium]|nr:hypothetical protein [Kofleriaceae bacterium]